ncbi:MULTISPECIES: type I pantothenate kinase [Arthrobacter]|uniref:Pantothenate kinase n=1 Tax=Arthrobacter caoxuetaonis TaxID=2886935 RepID=A0A9X1SAY0_9MICC|nr:type I pantothenate kinase [Arthrobacter caoxuetaonis]MCC3281156.1 type I pantothenate kinase [Arthrobacter caoxuetaonis]MCC3296593.1 type I pantothenate kinase [Arthrobacter caoxuetaonis]MCC9192669.1 type I pantothenate kinase [Arthrobacter sp. zg-Y916]USQ56579.1 type I pantothenate kinase [Arthrobacter caoxuetaonis]
MTEPTPRASSGNGQETNFTPFVELDRQTWSRLSHEIESPLNQDDITRLRGLGDQLNLDEVREVYLPLSRLLNLYVAAAGKLHSATTTFLGEKTTRTPFVIGVAGSVAVGKSTTARVLREMLRRWPDTPNVELITTDGFLYPNAELKRRGLMQRKGFPESYDRRRLLRFVSAVKSGAEEVRAPRYSHLTYDIVPGSEIVVRRPDVLIVEGLNVLAPARTRPDGRSGLALSDFFDFSIYVDARTSYIEEWYVQRFQSLRSGAFANPASYFHRYADLTDAEARETALDIWKRINEPNLVTNVLPTRGRAQLVLTKDADHSVRRMLLRKT